MKLVQEEHSVCVLPNPITYRKVSCQQKNAQNTPYSILLKGTNHIFKNVCAGYMPSAFIHRYSFLWNLNLDLS